MAPMYATQQGAVPTQPVKILLVAPCKYVGCFHTIGEGVPGRHLSNVSLLLLLLLRRWRWRVDESVVRGGPVVRAQEVARGAPVVVVLVAWKEKKHSFQLFVVVLYTAQSHTC